MGTNYYLKIDECEHCGRYEKKHIGKRSAAGRYCFDCGVSMCVDGEEYVHSGTSHFNKKCYKCNKTIETLKTDEQGEALGNIVLDTAWYKFMVEYEGVTYLDTTPTKMTSTTRTLQ